MVPRETKPPALETDERFPSGPWTGFFLQATRPGRQWMDLELTFCEGRIRGDGRDSVGKFLMTGRYEVADGKCHWTKTYLGQHSLSYLGYNEGKGIWGTWEMTSDWRGGFHVWPVAMGDPTQPRRAEEVDVPNSVAELFEPVSVTEPNQVGEPVGSSLGEPFGGLVQGLNDR